MWQRIACFLIFLKVFECYQKATPTELQNYLNLFKLRDIFISTSVNQKSKGIFFEAKDGQHNLQISVDECLLTMMFPEKNSWHKRIGVFLGEKCETDLMICLNENSLLVFDGCHQIFSDQLHELEFSFGNPEMKLLPNWKIQPKTFEIGSGFPISQKCKIIVSNPKNYTVESVESLYKSRSHPVLHSTVFSENVLEPPDDFDGCMINNELVKIGENNMVNCQKCTCMARDEVFCQVQECPHVKCEHPVIRDGECCATCGKQCNFEQRLTKHAHGEIFWPEDCYRCECWDGEVNCEKKNITCQTPLCPAKDWVIENDYQCCPKCKDDANFCETSPCHKYADCYNEKRGAKCICKEGFHGNGTFCLDIDECKFSQDARAQLGGCMDGTRCKNTLGSFECPCLPGYQRLTEQMCMPLLRV
ncbi:unnamed protein product [Caenorhabditis angaria]|uniref:Uncharacterized protein n=1 Tax=Caenorhabditis angaria TaxID=860376 RepID=A0A9P1J3G9_9PELO|nr:unnamed protein product [Caenorhabditis angaria]